MDTNKLKELENILNTDIDLGFLMFSKEVDIDLFLDVWYKVKYINFKLIESFEIEIQDKNKKIYTPGQNKAVKSYSFSRGDIPLLIEKCSKINRGYLGLPIPDNQGRVR